MTFTSGFTISSSEKVLPRRCGAKLNPGVGVVGIGGGKEGKVEREGFLVSGERGRGAFERRRGLAVSSEVTVNRKWREGEMGEEVRGEEESPARIRPCVWIAGGIMRARGESTSLLVLRVNSKRGDSMLC